MAYDVATGRIRVGLTATDTSQDVQILAAMNAALGFAEHYCDRQFLYKRETLSKVVDRQYDGIFVDRYPIGKIHSMTGAASSGTYGSHHMAGLVYLGNRSGRSKVGQFNGDQTVTIDYEGGYKTPPSDLEFALWSMFDSVWGSFDPSVSTGGGGTTVVAGQIKKRTIVGVGSVEYTTSADGASGSSGGSVSADWSAVMPGATRAILDLYSRKVA